MALESLLLGAASASSSSALVSTGLDAAGMSIGLPPGVGSGIMNTLLGVFGIKDLSCIGSQAFKKSNLEELLSSMKTRFEAITNTQNYADFMTWLSREISQRGLEAPRYKSSCSKAYNQQYIDKLNEMYKSTYKAGIFQETRITIEKDWKGGDLNYIKFTPIVLRTISINEILGITTIVNNSSTGVTGTVTTYTQGTIQNAIIPDSIMSQLVAQSSTSGVPLDTLQSTYLNGGFSIGNDGKIIWGVNAGNAQNNTLSYILLLGGAFLIYMAFFKKK